MHAAVRVIHEVKTILLLLAATTDLPRDTGTLTGQLSPAIPVVESPVAIESPVRLVNHGGRMLLVMVRDRPRRLDVCEFEIALDGPQLKLLTRVDGPKVLPRGYRAIALPGRDGATPIFIVGHQPRDDRRSRGQVSAAVLNLEAPEMHWTTTEPCGRPCDYRIVRISHFASHDGGGLQGSRVVVEGKVRSDGRQAAVVSAGWFISYAVSGASGGGQSTLMTAEIEDRVLHPSIIATVATCDASGVAYDSVLLATPTSPTGYAIASARPGSKLVAVPAEVLRQVFLDGDLTVRSVQGIWTGVSGDPVRYFVTAERADDRLYILYDSEGRAVARYASQQLSRNSPLNSVWVRSVTSGYLGVAADPHGLSMSTLWVSDQGIVARDLQEWPSETAFGLGEQMLAGRRPDGSWAIAMTGVEQRIAGGPLEIGLILMRESEWLNEDAVPVELRTDTLAISAFGEDPPK
jgi:hypothetical protein